MTTKTHKILVFLLIAGLSLALTSVAMAEDNNRGEQQKDINIREDIKTELQDRSVTASSSNRFENADNENGVEDSNSSSTDSNNKDDGNKGDIGEAHQSEVSRSVQSILDIADREGQIGQQVRDIANEEGSSTSKIKDELSKIENRSALMTFLIGSDYKNLGALRSEIVQTRNRIGQMTKLAESMPSSTDKMDLLNQIDSLEQAHNQLDSFVNANESKFSLFGWFAKLFR